MTPQQLPVKKTLYRVTYTPKHARIEQQKLIAAPSFEALTKIMEFQSVPRFAARELCEVLA